jgi:hypothetical protein
MAFNCAIIGIGISTFWFSTSIGTYHYRNWHLLLVPVLVLAFLNLGSERVLAHTITRTLAFKKYARTGIGIVVRCFITGMGIVCYWYWHLILPVPVLAFLLLGSLPVQAQSITRIGIQIWCPYQYWHFCTLVQYQYGHIPLPELGSQHGARTGTGIFKLRFSTGIGTVHYRYWHSVVPVSVLAFWHFGSVPVWAHTITSTGVSYSPYRYWHFCTSVQYPYRHIPLQVLAFNNGDCTGMGISALWFSTGIGTVHYQNWHSKMVPVPVLSFLHFGSVPVKAKSINGTGIQLWCPCRYWHFGTLIQYQYWHGTLLVLALKNTVPIKGICAFWFCTNNNTIIGRLQ